MMLFNGMSVRLKSCGRYGRVVSLPETFHDQSGPPHVVVELEDGGFYAVPLADIEHVAENDNRPDSKGSPDDGCRDAC